MLQLKYFANFMLYSQESKKTALKNICPHASCKRVSLKGGFSSV